MPQSAFRLTWVLGAATLAAQAPGAPNEDRVVYRAMPDIRVQLPTRPAALSALWRDKPLLVTLIFTRCAGICSPLLRSLHSAVGTVGGLGSDYRVLALSFDPRDTAADLDALADHLGVKANPAWLFGRAEPAGIARLAEATGFWFRWDQATEQYDHPGVVLVVDRGRILRLRAAGTVPAAYLGGVLRELRGRFVASYPLPGDVAFRCFDYDPQSGRFSLDWGAFLMILPGAAAVLAVTWVFRGQSRPIAFELVHRQDDFSSRSAQNTSEPPIC